jgi:5'-nucleotidase
VASGINPGRNVGRAVLHSGTVGAALTSVHFGLKGLATSIQAGAQPSAYEAAGSTHPHFGSAAALAVAFAESLEDAPSRTVLNLNVPDLPLAQIRGVRRAGLARTGLTLAAAENNSEPNVRLELSRQPADVDEDSDESLTALGWAVVTPLASIMEDHRPEVGGVVTAAVLAATKRLQEAKAATPGS